MTNPVTPATDEEVEAMREAWSAEPVSWVNTELMRLIARIDAERARAERLLNDLSEAALREANDLMQRLEMNKDAKALHVHALRVAADNAALRGELADAREWMKGSEKWDEVQATIRAHATKTEAERDAERAARERAEERGSFAAEESRIYMKNRESMRHALALAISVAEDCQQRWSRGHPERVAEAKAVLADMDLRDPEAHGLFAKLALAEKQAADAAARAERAEAERDDARAYLNCSVCGCRACQEARAALSQEKEGG